MRLNFLFILILLVLFSCIDKKQKFIDNEVSIQRQIDSSLVFDLGINKASFLAFQKRKTTSSFQLKGNVLKILQTNFWYKNDTSKVLRKLATDIYEFNSMKKLILHNSYADDGELFYTYTYQYDGDGFLINYSESNAVRFVVNTTPIYSIDGLIFKENHFNRDEIPIGESVVSFDAEERKITKTTTWTGGLTKNKVISKIDSLGNVIFNINYETVIDKEFTELAETANEYSYTNNLVVEEKQFLPWGIFENYKERLNVTIINKYGENKLLTERTYLNKSGEVDYVLTYTYSFDASDNWVVQTVFRNKKKYSQLEREINYYSTPTK